MGEARTVLYKRKQELEIKISKLTDRKIEVEKGLAEIMADLRVRKRMLKEVEVVYKALG